MGAILDLSERLLSGRLSTTEHHPFTPLLALEELAPGLAFLSSFANVTALDTPEGLVLIDVGSALLAAQTIAMVRGWSSRPVRAVVYTHGHIDHVGGAQALAGEAAGRGEPAPVFYGHRAVPARFDRYQQTAGYNGCVNTRQFRLPVAWPASYRYPDVLYDQEHVLSLGGEEVRLHHDRGETDDHTWAYLPHRRVLCTGDLFIWAVPNAGNPQKVQRYPLEWARALRRMGALGAQVLCPGHGPPIVGEAQVAQALGETAELLESLVAQTLALMNAGARLDDILHAVRAPAHLLERPYLRPVYDEPEFIVRNLWRLYGGWYDGNPAHLKPAPEARLAQELAALCGGAARLAERAQALCAAGDLALACHLAETAARAAPEDAAIWQVRAEVYRRRGEAESSLMARGIYLTAAEEALVHKRGTG